MYIKAALIKLNPVPDLRKRRKIAPFYIIVA